MGYTCKIAYAETIQSMGWSTWRPVCPSQTSIAMCHTVVGVNGVEPLSAAYKVATLTIELHAHHKDHCYQDGRGNRTRPG
jgi:phage-related protein